MNSPITPKITQSWIYFFWKIWSSRNVSLGVYHICLKEVLHVQMVYQSAGGGGQGVLRKILYVDVPARLTNFDFHYT